MAELPVDLDGPPGGEKSVTVGDLLVPSSMAVALSCAKLGWRVVPAHATEKRPGLKDWPTVATVDEDQIGEWWLGDFTGRAVCLVTGRESGVWVLDLDVKGDGPGTLAALESEWGALPETFEVRTPSGGRHLYFAYPADREVKNSVRKVGPGIDVRGEGGQVMAPGTAVNGKMYRLVNPVLPLAPAPAWLLKLTEVSGVGSGSDGEGSGGSTSLDEELESYLQHGLPAGAHDDTLTRVAARLVARGLGDAAIVSLLRALIQATVTGPVGWSDEKLQGKVTSAREKGYAPEPVDPALVEWAVGALPGAVEAPAVGSESGGGALTSTRGEPPASDKNADRFGNPGVPVETAVAVMRRLFGWVDGSGNRHGGLRHWRGEWRVYAGTHWPEVSEDAMRAVLYRWLAEATYTVPVEHPEDEEKAAKKRAWRQGRGLDPDFDERAWNPNRARIADVLGALAGLTEEAESREMPSWDGESGGGDGVTVPCANGLLRVTGSERVLAPHSVGYFCGHVLPFAYTPGAGCERWLRFLEEVFPKDPGSPALLQEWFGYVVSGRLDLQKMMMLVGASRSGKSTIAKVLTRLLGAENVAAPMLGSFAANFGLAALIGKPLAVVDDARYSSKLDVQAVTEKLLSIVGASALGVDRKNRAMWTGVLPSRLMISSNELPNFKDASDAITNRMLVLHFKESFLGREDLKLLEKLEAELPGILNWALEGLRRLNEQEGRFTSPGGAAAIVAELKESVNPMGTFLRECCVVGPAEWCVVTDFVAEWAMWHGGVKGDATSKGFETGVGMKLRAVLPGLEKKRLTVPGRGRVYCYLGVSVTSAVVSWAQGVTGEAGGEE